MESIGSSGIYKLNDEIKDIFWEKCENKYIEVGGERLIMSRSYK